MRGERLPVAQLPATAAIYTAFLDGKLVNWYPTPSSDAARNADRRRMNAVADVLERQNRKFGASDLTLANIEKLRNGAEAIVTGQQVTLFGGQLLSFLKALTAIKLGEESTRAGKPAAPIFWLATEDHDLAEVSSVHLLNSKHELRTARVSSSSIADAPVGGIRLGESIREAIATLKDALGENEISALISDCYAPEATFGHAFGRLYARLFAEFGLILIDNSDPELHELAKPIFAAAARQADVINSALLARDKELEAAGYHAQVKITKSSTLLFAELDGSRTAVQRVNGQYAIGNQRIEAAELVRQAEGNPAKFSANALLRPAVQDYLLPTQTYVGGPAEIAYFAQAQVVYRQVLGRVTPIVPRASATVIEPKIANLLEKYGLKPGDAFVREAELREKIARLALPEDLKDSFRAAREASDKCQQPLATALRKLDPTLVDAFQTAFKKIQYQITRLERRAAAAEVRRTDEIRRHAARISNSLYPLGQLQEREIAGVYFLARYGRGFLQDLYEAIDPRCSDHQVLYPES